MSFLQKKSWPPPLVGLGIAILYVSSWFLFAKMPGASPPFVRLAYWIEYLIVPAYVERSVYFHKFNTLLNWHVFLIIGIALGGALSAVSSRSWSVSQVPGLWAERFGRSYYKRFLGAFVGGMIMIIGARLAGGCTSGKGLAEGMVFLTPAYVFMGALFASGIVTAHLLYKRAC